MAVEYLKNKIQDQGGSPGFPVFDPDNLLRNVLGIEPEPLPDFDSPALTPMRVPLREATVGLLVLRCLLPGPTAAQAAQRPVLWGDPQGARLRPAVESRHALREVRAVVSTRPLACRDIAPAARL
jgi:hypothetical protein